MRLTGMTAALLAGTAFALAACNGAERPLTYEKGVYQGERDEELSPEQLETLRQRGTRAY